VVDAKGYLWFEMRSLFGELLVFEVEGGLCCWSGVIGTIYFVGRPEGSAVDADRHALVVQAV
jgi:hypothetical protein